MKYSTVRFGPKLKKGTSRRKRREFKYILEQIALKYGPKALEVSQQACMDQILYGEGQVKVSWDNEEIHFENVVPEPEATE